MWKCEFHLAALQEHVRVEIFSHRKLLSIKTVWQNSLAKPEVVLGISNRSSHGSRAAAC